MNHQKLFSLLASLTPSEGEGLSAFLRKVDAPAVLIPLGESLLDHHPAYCLDEQAWQRVYAAMWPGEYFRPDRLRNRLSQLYQWMQTYLAELALAHEPELRQRLYLSELQRRGLARNFEIELKAARQSQENTITDEGFFHQYQLAELANGYYGLRELRTEDDNLLQKLSWLDHYYFLVLLRESCELLNRSQILGKTYAERVPRERLESLPQRPDLWEVPLIRAYYRVFEMLSQPERAEPFAQLKSLLEAEANRFLPNEARALYRHAQNFCIRRINRGQPRYLAEVLELYQTQLASGVILVNGQLAHTDYKNISTAALRLKDFDWARQFLDQYRERVPASHRENVYQFCLASFHYETGDYEQVLRLLREVSFTDDFYQISARLLMLRTLFERGDWEALPYSVDALVQYLKRNRTVSRTVRNHYLAFLSYLKKLTRLADQRFSIADDQWESQRQALAQQLAEVRGVTHLSWLRQQAEALRVTPAAP